VRLEHQTWGWIEWRAGDKSLTVRNEHGYWTTNDSMMMTSWDRSSKSNKLFYAISKICPFAVTALDILPMYKPALVRLPKERLTSQQMEVLDPTWPIRTLNNYSAKMVTGRETMVDIMDEEELKVWRGADVRDKQKLRNKISRIRSSTVLNSIKQQFRVPIMDRLAGYSEVVKTNMLIWITGAFTPQKWIKWWDKIKGFYLKEIELIDVLSMWGTMAKKYSPILNRFLNVEPSIFLDTKKGITGYTLTESELNYSVVDDALELSKGVDLVDKITGARPNIRPYIQKLFQQMDWTPRDNPMSFSDWLANPLMWTTPGSSDRGRAIRSDTGEEIRLKKSAVLNFMNPVELFKSMNKSRQMNKPVFKMDKAGKGRTIYSSSPELYWLATYIMYLFPKLQDSIPGAPFGTTEVERAQNRKGWMDDASNGIPMAPVDYDKFDHNVSHNDIRDYYTTLIKMAIGNQTPEILPELTQIGEDILYLIDNTYMSFNNDEKTREKLSGTNYQVEGNKLVVKMESGLPSGRPETAIAGTMIQASWDSLFMDTLKMFYPKDSLYGAVWQGDDVSFRGTSSNAILRWVLVAESFGFKLNPLKFWVDAGKYSSTEFLRDRITSQWCTSPAANMIAALSERSPGSMEDLTWNDKISIMKRIGVDVAWRGLFGISSLISQDANAIAAKYDIPHTLTQVSVTLGGAGLHDSELEAWPRPPQWPNAEAVYSNLINAPDVYRSSVMEKIGEHWSSDVYDIISDRLQTNALNSIQDHTQAGRKANEYMRELDIWKQKVTVIALPQLSDAVKTKLNFYIKAGIDIVNSNSWVGITKYDMVSQAIEIEGKNWRQRFSLLQQHKGIIISNRDINRFSGALLWDLLHGKMVMPGVNAPSKAGEIVSLWYFSLLADVLAKGSWTREQLLSISSYIGMRKPQLVKEIAKLFGRPVFTNQISDGIIIPDGKVHDWGWMRTVASVW
jgi:hypothetical protein